MIDLLSEKGDHCCYLVRNLYFESKSSECLSLAQFLVQKFYDSVSLEVYVGWIKGSSVYTQVGFMKLAYTF